MIYAQGTHSFSSSASSVGSYVPGVGCVSATAYGHTTASTSLARLVAPPERPDLLRAVGRSIISAVVLTVITFNVLISGLHITSSFFAPLIFVPGLIAARFFIKGYIQARRDFKRELNEWGATWRCFRCGPSVD